MNYTTKGQLISVAVIERALKERLHLPRFKSVLKKMKADNFLSVDTQILEAAESLYKLNYCLYSDIKVFLKVEKSPCGNLNTGRHYYSVYYVWNNDIQKVWLYYLTEIFGGCTQNKYTYLPKWMYYSSAIGMSRAMDATDAIFSFLKSIGGCYAQIDNII